MSGLGNMKFGPWVKTLWYLKWLGKYRCTVEYSIGNCTGWNKDFAWEYK